MCFARLSFAYVGLNAFAVALILACGAARFVYILRVIRLVRSQRVLAVDFKGACMNNAATMVSSLIKKACIACLLILSLTGLALAVSPAQAYASPTYTMSVVGSDVPSSVNPGDSFTVSLTLENNDSSSYTMYAMSATVRYNTSMLEVVSMNTNNNIDVYTTSAGDGWTDAVLNFKASSLSGTTWDNGTSLMDVTFKAVDEGSTSMMIRRANISNSTGMGKYACTCNDAVITVTGSSEEASVAPVETSTSESEGTTEGIDAPEADPSELEGVDTSDTMTEEEKAEYEATKNGTLNAGSSSSSSTSGSASGSASGDSTGLASGSSGTDDGQTPIILYVLIGALVVVVIALIVGVIIHARRSKKESANDEFSWGNDNWDKKPQDNSGNQSWGETTRYQPSVNDTTQVLPQGKHSRRQ